MAVLFVCLGFASICAAQEEPKRSTVQLGEEISPPPEPDTDLIDIPTANVLDYGGFSVRSRFSDDGGVLTYFSFGVFQRLNFGASLNVDKLIGTDSPVDLSQPELQLRYRFYDGTRYLPAAAVGFDRQGYFYGGEEKPYEKGRGFYIVGSQEVLFPGLMVHGGLNISNFKTDAVFAFLGAGLNIEDKAKIMVEWDNLHNVDESRFNVGILFNITPFFNINFAVREIGQGGKFGTPPDGVPHARERIVQLKYVGSF